MCSSLPARNSSISLSGNVLTQSPVTTRNGSSCSDEDEDCDEDEVGGRRDKVDGFWDEPCRIRNYPQLDEDEVREYLEQVDNVNEQADILHYLYFTKVRCYLLSHELILEVTTDSYKFSRT